MHMLRLLIALMLGRGVFPHVVNTVASTGSNNASQTLSLSAALPGDYLLLLCGQVASNTMNTPSGWTLLRNTFNGTGTSDRRLMVFYKLADGSEGSTLNITTSESAGDETVAAICMTVRGASAPPECSSAVATGASASPNPPSFTPSWGNKKALWIAAAAPRSTTVSGYPSGYSGGTHANNGTTINVASAWLKLQAATEDPAAFTTADDSWVATTMAFRGE